MAITQILPNIGSPVSSPAFDESAAEAMSIGEAAYAATFFLKIYAKKLADPAAANEIAQFLQASGQIGPGFNPTPPQPQQSTPKSLTRLHPARCHRHLAPPQRNHNQHPGHH